MKRILTLVFITALVFQLNGQYVDNRLDIYAGGGLSIPLGGKNAGEENFIYPSLFGNFTKSLTLKTGINYWLKKDISFGLEYENVSYQHWVGDEQLFILMSPELKLQSISLNLGYYSDFLKNIGIPGKIGILAGPDIGIHSLRWNSFSYSFYHPNLLTLPHEENLICPGIKAGIRYTKQLYFNTGIQFDFSYKYTYAPGLYYIEKSFQSVDLSVMIIFRALKNRHYNYV